MFRYIDLEIPAGTPETAPATKPIQLRHGVITFWWVGFPPGCAALAHVAIYHFERRIIPRHEVESLYWDGYIFEIPDSYKLEEEPYEVEVRAWNNDDSYPHTIVVGVAVVPIEEVTLKDMFGKFLRAMVGEV